MPSFSLPDYTPAERLFDNIVHVVGVLAGLTGAVLLIVLVSLHGDAPRIATTSVYSAGLVAMLSLSAAYNMARHPGVKRIMRRFDHSAIYLMIAGTYTPLSIVTIGGWLGITLVSVVWAAALTGITLKMFWPDRFERTSLVLYLAMGWVGGIAVLPLAEALPTPALVLLAAGGLLYTAGVPFHLSRLKFQNAIWHCFVLAGAACHFGTIAYSVGGA